MNSIKTADLTPILIFTNQQRLTSAVSKLPYDYDFLISPFSIWSLLVLEAEGADGDTLKQLQTVLRLPPELSYLRAAYSSIQDALIVNTSTVELSVNQVLFTDLNRPVDYEYQYRLENVYRADQHAVNFEDSNDAYNTINGYINDRSHGKIKRIVNYEDLRDAQMMLISAIYFKGQWKVIN